MQAVLLGLLDLTGNLSVVGWLTGMVYGFTLSALVSRVRFGPADWVTLSRATLVGCVTALTAESLHRPISVPLLVTITSVALVLDAVDGRLARSSRTASAFGARFDMEVDAFLIMVLCVYVARSVGAWVLVIGAMRYAYVAASWVLAWMRRPLPARYWRKVVAAIQGITLLVVSADILPVPTEVAALAIALALLVESFGRDVVWLYLRRA